MIHYGVLWLASLGLLAFAFLKLNRLRWFIGIGSFCYLFSFIFLMVWINVGHDYDMAENRYDYIVVFGGGLDDNQVNEVTIMRLDTAINALSHTDSRIIVSGGYGNGIEVGKSEAHAMKEYLVDNGVGAEIIYTEEQSESTWENLVYTKALIEDLNYENPKVLGISSDYHLNRINFLSDRLDFKMDTLPSKSSIWAGLSDIPREYYATIKSWIVDQRQTIGRVVLRTYPSEVHAVARDVINQGFDPLHEHSLKTATISAVGDIMVHRSQLIRAYDDGGFDFSPSFRWVTPYISKADYAIGNLETTLAAAHGQRRLGVDKFFRGYSGYPVFNTPDIMAANLKNTGFDLLLTANNHTLDSKVSGMLRTLDILDSHGLGHIGTYRTIEEAEDFFVKEVNGITFGIINYTYAMNGFWLNDPEDYRVNHLGNYDETYIQGMYDEVKSLSAEKVDFVVVALHYGIEYVNEPDSYIQQPLIDGLFNSGADIILGGHPHVLQPFEVRDLVREDGQEETGVVIYSLGNFISSQRHRYTKEDTDFGMIFELDFKKVDEQKATIEAIRYAPTYVYWSETDLEIIPMMDIPEEVELSLEDHQRILYAKEEVIPLINSYYGRDYVLNGAYLEFELE